MDKLDGKGKFWKCYLALWKGTEEIRADKNVDDVFIDGRSVNIEGDEKFMNKIYTACPQTFTH